MLTTVIYRRSVATIALPSFGSIFNSFSLSLINAATSRPNRTVHIHNQGRTSSRCDKSEHYTSTTTQKKGGGKSRSQKSSQQQSRMHMHRREYLFALRQRTAAGNCQTWKLYDRLQGLECPQISSNGCVAERQQGFSVQTGDSTDKRRLTPVKAQASEQTRQKSHNHCIIARTKSKG
jgi:hypothetical protein